MRKYKNLFIDLDDTLWDFSSNARFSLYQVYRQFHLEKYYSEFDRFGEVYMTRNAELWQVYQHAGITREELMIERFRHPLRRIGIINDRLALSMNDFYLAVLGEQKKLIPYAREALDYLSKRYRLFILSNGFREVQYKKLKATDLLSYFERIILSDEAGVNKPDPRIFSFALARAGATADDSVMIGDNFEADIQGAARAGIDQIYFNPPDEIPECGFPTYTLKSWKEVEKIL